MIRTMNIAINRTMNGTKGKIPSRASTAAAEEKKKKDRIAREQRETRRRNRANNVR